MTGTADTEAYEFRQIYGLDVVVIPTNVPVKRIDHNDLVYMTMEEKFEAIVADVIAERDRGRPVLVGTASVEASEVLSQFLEKEGIQHNVLNAKQHEREAPIIAEAGRPGAITIATNMAGRGTDIMLGGNWQAEVAELDAPTETQIESIKTDWQARHDACWKPVDCTSSVLSVTNLGALITSCADDLAVRAILVRRDFSCHWKTI